MLFSERSDQKYWMQTTYISILYDVKKIAHTERVQVHVMSEVFVLFTMKIFERLITKSFMIILTIWHHICIAYTLWIYSVCNCNSNYSDRLRLKSYYRLWLSNFLEGSDSSYFTRWVTEWGTELKSDHLK